MHYLQTIAYGWHVIFHPFDGFWDLKREKRGSLGAALTFVILAIVTCVIKKQNTAFLFNMNKLEEVNALVDIITIVLLYVLWCVANWCLTSLMDGKGHMKDIVISTAYAFVPFIIIQLPLVGMSHLITVDEGTFYYVFSTMSLIWTGGLLFFGTMVTHEYTIKKTIMTIICTLIGMSIISFIGLLFFSVIQQMIDFVLTLYKEIRFR